MAAAPSTEPTNPPTYRSLPAMSPMTEQRETEVSPTICPTKQPARSDVAVTSAPETVQPLMVAPSTYPARVPTQLAPLTTGFARLRSAIVAPAPSPPKRPARASLVSTVRLEIVWPFP